MAENKHTLSDLYQMQSLPLSAKIRMTVYRIRQWVEEYGTDGVYVSFSGGKDSTVLLDIVRNECGYKDIPAVFVDVPTQYPELRDFAKTFDNVEIIKPKISFVQVCEKYGFPLISKEVSECVSGARKYLTQIKEEMMKKREEQRCIYCNDLLGKKGCLGMCNKHYIQYKRWGDPLHADNKERATVDGYYRDGKTGRREHRVIYEEYYGVKLTKNEIIHHINFVKTDNRIENLWKYPNASEHIKAHREFERLQADLKENQEIYFDNGKYIIRERERERESTTRQTEIPYRYYYDKVTGNGKYKTKANTPNNAELLEEYHLKSIRGGQRHYYYCETAKLLGTRRRPSDSEIYQGGAR